ncbi:hypothetical protein G5C51_14790 [Streptomyces sp. A7024]|uniref:Lipoprotein n=1 Tax=Streptomyces coryli TaxID=1128680 RepID=A0A6G4U073_9ACTN|nr:hypothetical protein [Streptomyces coryli]NGN65160.1 hypothetical protein [Streptomyces coryli]
MTRAVRSSAASAAAFAVFSCLAAAGCSEHGAIADGRSSGDPARMARAVRDAADGLVKSGSSAARTAMQMNSGGTRVTVRGTGGFDYGARRGRLDIVLPQSGPGGGGRERPAPIRELYAAGALYMKNRGAGVPSDKWLRLDTTELADGNLVTNGATDPLTAAELLRGAGKVTCDGQDRLRGDTVRHCSGTTDIGRAAKAASAYARGSLEAAAKGFAKDSVPFDAYLDDDGRLRKVRYEFAFAQQQEVEVVSTTEIYGFGEPVKVALPADGDIYAGKVEP